MKTKPLMTLQLEPGPVHELGALTVYSIAGGEFRGDELRGRVLPGGADWITTRPDGVKELDLRVTLETDDGALIDLKFRGIIDKARDYFRTIFRFETAVPKYVRLNSVFAVSHSQLTPKGPLHTIEEIL